MKFASLSLLIFCSLILSSCYGLENSAAKINNNLAESENHNSNGNLNNTDKNKTTEKPPKVLQVSSKNTLVWVGQISPREIKDADGNNSTWNNAELDNDPPYNKTGTTIEVDIMNCAGYLISGQLYKEEDHGLSLRTIPETAAADAIEKIKQCDPNPEDEFSLSISFAIAPANVNRKNIKVGTVDTKKIYDSLPANVKKWLEEDKVAYEGEEGKYYRRKEKGNLTLQDDNWTDIDGDGEIDLVSVSAVISPLDTEGDTSSRIFMRINGKWKKIGYTQKA